MSGNRELVERFIASLEARDWDNWAALLHPAVVYEIPQSRERIRGRDRYLRFNQEYPGDWHLRPKVVIADEQHGVAWFEWHLDDRIDDGMASGAVTVVRGYGSRSRRSRSITWSGLSVVTLIMARTASASATRGTSSSIAAECAH